MRCGHLRYTSVTRSRGSTRYDATVAGKQAILSDLAERPRRAGPESAAEGQLMRVRFTTDDLLRTHFGEAPAPLAEVSAGMLELRRPSAGTVPGRWVIREAGLPPDRPASPGPDTGHSARADLR